MIYINRARGTGKTTMLIHAAFVTGYPIIVWDSMRAQAIKQQAKSMECDVDVYSWKEFKQYGFHDHDKILIDEATDFISTALREMLGAEVVSCSMSIPCYQPKESEVKENE